ncbi:HypC/HybG/HupF family hydrogenase formation chaperone [Gordonia sp. PP30]|uniref:HypC/HybG/HupF family hydrogenase formation chaperone n=1 Tax=Gordonia sp. PP30 TaxID=2935861 RepID=UPI001FFE3C27|nr:HypC/HybG/HupF family hydrogenase formation chaperone [Gordonia sp. PP30]UQE76475.1 HypC/HybG/HupF family hydrogenase formation chaperone [Gordonia sp. PP30]
MQRWEEGAAPFAVADFAGERRKISLAFLPELTVGDFVIVHAGFALTRVPPENVEMVMESITAAGLLVTADGAPADDGSAEHPLAPEPAP